MLVRPLMENVTGSGPISSFELPKKACLQYRIKPCRFRDGDEAVVVHLSTTLTVVRTITLTSSKATIFFPDVIAGSAANSQVINNYVRLNGVGEEVREK
jgi:hypothetical protein